MGDKICIDKRELYRVLDILLFMVPGSANDVIVAIEAAIETTSNEDLKDILCELGVKYDRINIVELHRELRRP